MRTDQKRRQRALSIAGILGFILRFVALVDLISFKTGMRYQYGGRIVFALGVITLVLLLAGARQKKSFWILVAIQMVLLTGVLIETFSDARITR